MAPPIGANKNGRWRESATPIWWSWTCIFFEIIWCYSFFLWKWRFICNAFLFNGVYTPFILVLMHLVVFFPTLFFLLGKPHKKQQLNIRNPQSSVPHPRISGLSLMPRYVLSERFLHSKRKRAGLRSIPQAVMSGALMLSNLEIFADKFCFRLMTSEWKSKMAMRFFRRHCRGVNYSKWCFMYIQLNIFVLYVDLLFYMHGRAN